MQMDTNFAKRVAHLFFVCLYEVELLRSTKKSNKKLANTFN